jgi:hypothetical protein
MVKLQVFNKMVEITAEIKVSQKYGMTGLHYPAENSQGKWNETTDSDSSEGWKSDGCYDTHL